MKINLGSILLSFIFKFSIFVDLINGYFQLVKGASFPIASMLRLFIIALLIYFVFNQGKTKETKYIIVTTILFCLCFVYWAINNGDIDIFIEADAFIRIMYLFLLIVYMQSIYLHKSNLIESLIVNYGFIIALCILFSFFTGIGHYSYGENYGFGTKSFFTAGNDVSIALLFASIVGSKRLFSHFCLFTLLKYCTMCLGSILIGTRTGIIGTCIISILSLLYYIFVFSPKKKSHILIKRVTIVSFVPIIIYASVKVLEFIWLAFDQYAKDRFSFEVIFSARDHLTACAQKYIDSLSGLSWLFGNGRYEYSRNVARYLHLGMTEKIAEADFHDIVGSYGYFLGFILLLPIIYMTSYSLSYFLKDKSFSSFLTLVAAMLFLYIGYSAGHCIANVMLAPIYSFLFAMAYYKGNILRD